jgi:hypothetical protein
MEDLNYILNNHTDLVFYSILAVIFGSVLLRLVIRRSRRKNHRRRFDDRS